MGARIEQDDDLVAGINITPFVDVVLVLLVVFMVTARLDAAASVLPQDLPTAQHGQAEEAQFAISIDADDRVWLGGEAIDVRRGLHDRAARALREDPELRAVIAASAEAHYATIAGVLDTLRSAGVSRIGFAVSPAGEEAP